MTIKILGSGCPKCQTVEQNAKKAVEELSLKDVHVELIYDINKIIEMGVMMTPGLAIDGQVVLSGKVPSVDELKKILA